MVAYRNSDRVLRGGAHDICHLGMIVADHVNERTLHRACDDRCTICASEAISSSDGYAKSCPPDRADVRRMHLVRSGNWCHLRVIAHRDEDGLLDSASHRLGDLGVVAAHCGSHRFGNGGVHYGRAINKFEVRRHRLTHPQLPPPRKCRGLRADGDLGVVAHRNIDRVLRGGAHNVRHLGMIFTDHINERTLHRACDDRRAVCAAEATSCI